MVEVVVVAVAVAAVMIIVKKINKCNEKMIEKKFSSEEPCACTICFHYGIAPL